MTQPRPGWYPDPSDPSHQRYFDGKAWTEKYAPFGAPTLPVDAPTKPGMSRGLKIGLGVGAAALAFIAIGAIGNSEKKSNSSSSTTVTVTRTVASAPPTAALARADERRTRDHFGRRRHLPRRQGHRAWPIPFGWWFRRPLRLLLAAPVRTGRRE